MEKPVVVTICSHSSLQIFLGAKREGLQTIGIVDRRRAWFYEMAKGRLLDHLVVVDEFRELCSSSFWRRVEELAKGPIIIVPHGSFVEYVGAECFEALDPPVFGLRGIVRVEADQWEKMRLLEEAGIPTPKSYHVGEDFDGLVIVKLPGAKGGRGYFIARSRREVEEGVKRLIEEGIIEEDRVDDIIVQEYVVGTPLYVHYFYSVVRSRLELIGLDIRYESNVDGLRRLPPRHAEQVQPSYTVVGNIPVVARESLLPLLYKYGLAFVEATRRRIPPGIIGPFSLEGVVTPNLEYKVFEFSGRIVAGTNTYMWHGSPYTLLWWDEPIDMGRRIAIEIREAWEHRMLDKVTT